MKKNIIYFLVGVAVVVLIIFLISLTKEPPPPPPPPPPPDKDLKYLDSIIDTFDTWSNAKYYNIKSEIDDIIKNKEIKKDYIFSLNSKILGVLIEEVDTFYEVADYKYAHKQKADSMKVVLKGIQQEYRNGEKAGAIEKLETFTGFYELIQSAREYIKKDSSTAKNFSFSDYEGKINDSIDKQIELHRKALLQHKNFKEYFDLLYSDTCDCKSQFTINIKNKLDIKSSYYIKKCKEQQKQNKINDTIPENN